jgi:diaminopimelate decarboxylase
VEKMSVCTGIGPLDAEQMRCLANNEPAFFYDRSRLNSRIADLRKALPKGTNLAYSLKANPHPALVQQVVSGLNGADVTSYAEMIVALNAGVQASVIMFAGPAKKDMELRAAVALGVGVCVESRRELERLAAIAKDLSRVARVFLRINPDFALSGASMRMGGAPTQFGIDARDVPGLWPVFADPALRFCGIHIYWGSQCLSEPAIEEAQRVAVDLIERLAPDFPSVPEIFNLGGGFGIPYFERDRALDLGLIGAGFAPLLARLQARFPATAVFLELGRYMVGEAGLYVCNVVDRKMSYGVDYIVTDGGMHHFLASTGNLGQKIRRNYPVSLIPVGRPAPGIADESLLHPYEIVGSLCTPIDLLAHKIHGPEIRIGDMIGVHCAGAYGKSASPADFLSHPHAREFLV